MERIKIMAVGDSELKKIRSGETARSKEIFQEIGRFIAYFSQLEENLRYIVAAELNISNDKERVLVLNLLDYSSVCNAARRLLLLQDPTERPSEKVIQDVIGRCLAIGGQRNIIAHGAWDVRKGTQHTNRQSLMSQFSFCEPNELEEITEKIWNLTTEVMNLYVMFTPEIK